mmetsp:Transcript_16216/g.44625  ORF Transcript_16216/g.44625 Transcript_16216/m.44625 type:complete len:97 (+) Transcript_16216:601-891(+)
MAANVFVANLNKSSVGNSSLYDAVGDERYASANMIITYPSEPSNYFHFLRRQLTWPFHRPLVVLTPTRTLRLAEATSNKNHRQPKCSFVIISSCSG